MLPTGVRSLSVPAHDDARGRLYAIEQSAPLPFMPVRMFMICDVPAEQVRARHAVSCHEFLWMLRGSCTATVDDGIKTATVPLKAEGPGLLVAAGVWMELRAFSNDAALSVFASKTYAETRYFDAPQPALIARFD
jgi:hypothetical protein